MKVCTVCLQEKEAAAFSTISRTNLKRKASCRTCRATQQRQWSKDNLEYKHAQRKKWAHENEELLKDINLKYKFGITLEEYNTKLAAQNHGCAICNKSAAENGKRHAVDHDHETKKIRGLLCDNCNRALGKMKDNPALLRKAADYLEHYETSGGI